MGKQVDFFLGANSPDGFKSFFNNAITYDNLHRAFLIKSGPGTGKSTLIKKIEASFSEEENFIERIHCSSDPDSLDGVILHGISTIIIDATAPHVVEPDYPGAYENVVSLYDAFDNERLNLNREKIISLFMQNKLCHKRCCNFLNAASLLFEDNYNTALAQIDSEKIKKYAKRVAIKEFSKKGNKPKENKRVLNAVTPDGIVVYEDTLATLCPNKIYVIKDEYGAVSNLLLSEIRTLALFYGHEIYTCYNPLYNNDKIEYILIPKLGIGFATSSKFNNYSFEPYRIIHYSRFLDSEELKKKKQRLNFNRRAAGELISEAVIILKIAKKIHSDLEDYYIASVNFEKVNKKTENLIKKLSEYYIANPFNI